MKLKGFTLLELLISLTIFSIIVAAATTVFLNSQATKQRVDLMTQAQQSARTAIDYMIRDIRAAGYNIDVEETEIRTPQRRIVYASSYEIIFNANILPAYDTPGNPKEPRAMLPIASIAERPAHYNPTIEYETGAETVIYTLDWNNDGLIDGYDRGEGNASPAVLTKNPNDYCLVKRVYGKWDTGLNSKPIGISEFGWTNQELISIVGGPDRYPSQSTGIPLFLYWIDDDGDATTPSILYGDSDGDGEISDAEANALSPILNYETLEKIELVRVNVTGVSSSSFRGVYQQANIATDVSVTRNVTSKVYIVKGHVYEDADTDATYDVGEDGIEDMKVQLSSGEFASTDEDGIWTFAIIPGTYGVSVSPKILWRATTPVNFDFSVSNGDIDFTIDANYKDYFGMEQVPPAYIRGIVFNDLNGDGLWQQDSAEIGISGIEIATWNSNTMSDDTGFYDLTVNAGETLSVWASIPLSMDSFASSGVDTIDVLGIGTASTKPIPISLSMAQAYLLEDEIAYLGFGLLKATGTKPSATIIYPNGGELITSGSTETIKTFANSNDSGEVIKRMVYYFSIDAGYNWQYIGEESYPSPALGIDTFYYDWTIADTIEGSHLCLVRVEIIDEGNWTVTDMSDNYFTIVPVNGYKSLYFVNEYVDSLKDDSLYLYAFYSDAVGFSGPLPRYLNSVNSNTGGILADSLPDSPKSTFYEGRPFYTQMGTYGEFVTEKGIPYADSIRAGIWTFLIWGTTDSPDTNYEKWYDFEVYLCDSFGASSSRQLLFSTLDLLTYDSLYHSSIGNDDAEDTVIVKVDNAWNVDMSDRIYIKTFYSGTFRNRSGNGGKDNLSAHIWFHFGGDWRTKVILP